MNDTKTEDTVVPTTDLEAKLAEMENNWKRALADYRNLQKRTAEEQAELVKFANFVLCGELMPILDNLEALWKHNKDEGIKLIIKGFSQALENSGVEEVKVQEGDLFDPNVMEALETPDNGAELICVASIAKKGYKMNGRLIRPVQVRVKACEKGN